jgi:hypothetical protein
VLLLLFIGYLNIWIVQFMLGTKQWLDND